MKILMLGWEYPPHITGGLGTACQGLTTSLASQDVDIDMVVPRVYGDEPADHMGLLDARVFAQETLAQLKASSDRTSKIERPPRAQRTVLSTEELKRTREIQKIHIPALLSPYGRPESYAETYKNLLQRQSRESTLWKTSDPTVARFLDECLADASSPDFHYGPDLFEEVARYARNVVVAAMGRSFDIIHAHDWMTYPAGIALSRATGAPLVVHVHSLEFDRSGQNVNSRIHQIEREGVEAADKVIAVSHYTRSLILEHHGIAPSKVEVVHNGVYSKEVAAAYRPPEARAGSKMVLFLGRVTFQKGPDYFVEAAARVIPEYPDVTFVMAGSGDMLPRLMERVAELGLAKHFVFTGFLKGPEVERIFSMADLYVMPSVSEPFGITPLEAISYDVPVIISRQSGVSEVLKNALKVDFWDVDRLAHFIIAVLKYPEIREDIVSMAREEVRRLHWDLAAKKTLGVYQQTLRRS